VRRRAWRRAAALALAAALFGADRWVEGWILGHLPPGASVPVLPPLLWLTVTENRGAAFGLLQHRHWFLVAVAVVVMIGAILVLFRVRTLSRALVAGLGLVMGGAAGNLWDRLVSGRVVDYIYVNVGFWPVFNLADAAIVVGMALLLWEAWRRDHGPQR
jgi:signal peptidase II